MTSIEVLRVENSALKNQVKQISMLLKHQEEKLSRLRFETENDITSGVASVHNFLMTEKNETEQESSAIHHQCPEVAAEIQELEEHIASTQSYIRDKRDSIKQSSHPDPLFLQQCKKLLDIFQSIQTTLLPQATTLRAVRTTQRDCGDDINKLTTQLVESANLASLTLSAKKESFDILLKAIKQEIVQSRKQMLFLHNELEQVEQSHQELCHSADRTITDLTLQREQQDTEVQSLDDQIAHVQLDIHQKQAKLDEITQQVDSNTQLMTTLNSNLESKKTELKNQISASERLQDIITEMNQEAEEVEKDIKLLSLTQRFLSPAAGTTGHLPTDSKLIRHRIEHAKQYLSQMV
ncbi:hypothetical protein BLNAU_19191 [Blattamonas nauphoetae]|uniref:Uncharacterized protein n=1 Tax=Blattamonas nauphoetae TaxID=2049346 RepID=A0ABQ9X6E2_9EUKA|nr:hypothetical protein BLNAU_19191 [Blattamonas nauphoetae]